MRYYSSRYFKGDAPGMITLSPVRGALYGLIALALCVPLGLPGRDTAGLAGGAMAAMILSAVVLGGVRGIARAQVIRILKTAALPIALIALPFVARGNLYVLDAATLILIMALAATGLNITVGNAGLMNTGAAGLFAVGAYTYALLHREADIGFWGGLLPATAVGALVGRLYALPVLRLRGDYLAVVTLGFAEILRITLINADTITGGAAGVIGIPGVSFFGIAAFAPFERNGLPPFAPMFGLAFSPLHKKLFFYTVTALLWGAAAVFCVLLRRSRLGRRLEAMREDPIACDSLGIRRPSLIMHAFTLSGALIGLAGALFAARQGFVSPDSFTFNESVLFLVIVVAGGMSTAGILPAAAVIVGLPEMFRAFAAWRMPIFGLALTALIVLRPHGFGGVRRPSVRCP